MSRDYSLLDRALDGFTSIAYALQLAVKWLWNHTGGKVLDLLVDDGEF